MSEYQLSLTERTLSGKKLKALRAESKIPAVLYGTKEPILLQVDYVPAEKVLRDAGYHSVIDLKIGDQTKMAIVKNIDIDPISRRIVNIEFQAVAANKAVEATTPIVIVGFETSEANKLHLALSQVMEEVDIKAKPSDLPKELSIDGSKLASVDDKLTLAEIELPKDVEFAEKELDLSQVVATIYDPVAEAAAREAAEAAETATEASESASEEGEQKSSAESSEDAESSAKDQESN